MEVRKFVLSLTLLAPILIGVTACSEDSPTQPKFERPRGSIIGLDRSKRISGRDLGGNAAMAEISSRMGPVTADSEDPLVQAVAEWRAKQGTVSGSSASRLYEGVEFYDGDYFVWSGGESYAPIEKQAKIYQLVARASRLGDPVDIDVTFKFDGHRASNEAKWTLTRSNGEVLVTRPWGSFGSQTDPVLGLSVFGQRGWAAHATEYVTGCDIVVRGNTEAKAWYEGFWDIGGISFGINPQGSNGQINLTKARRGETQAGASLNTQFTCPPPSDQGSGGGYGGGGDDCYVCQQWFLVLNEDWILEWWECGPASPQACQEYVV